MNSGVNTRCNPQSEAPGLSAGTVRRPHMHRLHQGVAIPAGSEVRPNVRWDHIKGAKTAILSVNIAFTATLQGHVGTPCVAGMLAPSVRFRRTRPSHD